ncbi:MAG TPA: bifunctional phosphopantothenoylcysteine decarboxylase/phosphopantothenate--cysteine ligase CoaBC [Flavisolibacter sp.]
MLKGKKILIGITGSIAAYKIPLLLRLLTKGGAEVQVVMTAAASDFVSRLTLSTLSQHPVRINLFDEDSWANHVALGRWADVFVIAPLSCNTLSKMVQGQCDNLLLATYLSATCPVIAAPAMDEDMWHHPATKNNLKLLSGYGTSIIPVEYGSLASGLTGDGRMAEPETILDHLTRFFEHDLSLKGKKVLVTAGPTYEAIDPVRFIGNHSSGKMGFALAEECSRRGAEVVLVSGPVSVQTAVKSIEVLRVTSASEMFEACSRHSDYDLAIMAAAVADYAPRDAAHQKIKKVNGELVLQLKRTTDILATLGVEKKGHQLLVGFALETQDARANARAKLLEKGADLIVLNTLEDSEAGFGKDTNKVSLFFKNGDEKDFEAKPKPQVAKDIIDSIIGMMP